MPPARAPQLRSPGPNAPPMLDLRAGDGILHMLHSPPLMAGDACFARTTADAASRLPLEPGLSTFLATPEYFCMYLSILAVGIGGALGSLFRWFLGIRLNGLFTGLPLGTFAANVIAGYVIGVAVAGFARAPQIAPEWRLFVITGLMGGLSTFSTFSAEVVQRLQDGRLGWAAGEIVIHVTASLVMTILGIATVSLLSR
ncbi:CrcB protein [Paraburkholderia sp. GAS348]